MDFGAFIVLAIFFVAIMIILIIILIKLRYKDIRLLRAIGAGKFIFYLFLIEIEIFFLINLGGLALTLIKLFLFKANS
ncbi:hypothetical protein OC709_01740 ['Planchonia careya' phytoplasma]|nr:hypothetical protein ['Planchonia careya' phytoplasma]MDO8030232.1 hypothetical protein ['Planchonia careya' phytoplasma]